MRKSPAQNTIPGKGLLAHKYSGNTVNQPIRTVQPMKMKSPSPVGRGPPVVARGPQVAARGSPVRAVQKPLPPIPPALPTGRQMTQVDTREEERQTIDINLNINVNAGNKQEFNVNLAKQNNPKAVQTAQVTPVMQHPNRQIRQPMNVPMSAPIQRLQKASPPRPIGLHPTSIGIPAMQRVQPRFAPGTKFVPMVPMAHSQKVIPFGSQRMIEAPVQTDPIDYVEPRSQLWRLNQIIDSNEVIQCIICHEVYGVMDTNEHVARHRRLDHGQPLQMSKLNRDFSSAEMRPIVEPQEYIIKPVQNIYVLEKINKGGRSSFQQVQQPPQIIQEVHVQPQPPIIQTIQVVPQPQPPINVVDSPGIAIGGGGPNRLLLDDPAIFEDHFINGAPIVVETPKQNSVTNEVILPPANTILDNYGIAMHSSGKSRRSQVNMSGVIQPGALNQLIQPLNTSGTGPTPIYDFQPNSYEQTYGNVYQESIPMPRNNLRQERIMVDNTFTPNIVQPGPMAGVRFVQSEYNGQPPPIVVPAVSMANSVQHSTNQFGQIVEYPSQFQSQGQAIPIVNHNQLTQLISGNGVNGQVMYGSRLSRGSAGSINYPTNVQNQMPSSLLDLIAPTNEMNAVVHPPATQNSFLDQISNQSYGVIPEVLEHQQVPFGSISQPPIAPVPPFNSTAQLAELIAAPNTPVTQLVPTIVPPPTENVVVVSSPQHINLFRSPQQKSIITPPPILQPPLVTSQFRPMQTEVIPSQPVLSTIQENSISSHKSSQGVVSKLQPQATTSQQHIPNNYDYNYNRGHHEQAAMQKTSQRMRVPMNIFAATAQN